MRSRSIPLSRQPIPEPTIQLRSASRAPAVSPVDAHGSQIDRKIIEPVPRCAALLNRGWTDACPPPLAFADCHCRVLETRKVALLLGNKERVQ